MLAQQLKERKVLQFPKTDKLLPNPTNLHPQMLLLTVELLFKCRVSNIFLRNFALNKERAQHGTVIAEHPSKLFLETRTRYISWLQN